MRRVLLGIGALVALVGAVFGPMGSANAAQVFTMGITVNNCQIKVSISSDYDPADAFASVDIRDANGAGVGFSQGINGAGDFDETLDPGTDVVLSSSSVTVDLKLIDSSTFGTIDSLSSGGTLNCPDLSHLHVTKDVVNFPPGLTDPFRFELHRGSCNGTYVSDFELPALGGGLSFLVAGDTSYCVDETVDNGAATVDYSPSQTVLVPGQGGSASVAVTNTFDKGNTPALGSVFLGCNVRTDAINLQPGDVVRTYIFDGTQVSKTFLETIDQSGETHPEYGYGTDFAVTEGQFFVYAQVIRGGDQLILEADAVSPEDCNAPSGLLVKTTFVNPPDPLADQVLLEVRSGDCNGPAIAEINDFEAKTYGPLAVDAGTYCLVVTGAAGSAVTYGTQMVDVDDTTETLDTTLTWPEVTTTTTTTTTTSTTSTTATTQPTTETTAEPTSTTMTSATSTTTASVALARTGTNLPGLLGAGVSLLAAGALALLARRRLATGRG